MLIPWAGELELDVTLIFLPELLDFSRNFSFSKAFHPSQGGAFVSAPRQRFLFIHLQGAQYLHFKEMRNSCLWTHSGLVTKQFFLTLLLTKSPLTGSSTLLSPTIRLYKLKPEGYTKIVDKIQLDGILQIFIKELKVLANENQKYVPLCLQLQRRKNYR